jgi:hypothetical protein
LPCRYASSHAKVSLYPPAYSQFIEALLAGDKEKAFQVVKSIDIDNLGTRFITPATRDRMKEDKGNALIQTKK